MKTFHFFFEKIKIRREHDAERERERGGKRK